MRAAGLKWPWLLLMVVEVVLCSASRTQASSVLVPIFTSTSGSKDLMKNDDEQATLRVNIKTPEAFTNTEEEITTVTVVTAASTAQRSAVTTASASESSSASPTPLRISTSQAAGPSFSSQPGSSSLSRTLSARSSTEPQLGWLTTSALSAQKQIITGKTHLKIPSQLNVGNKDFRRSSHRSKTLDPLLAGLLSVSIVTTAVVFVVLFLKFRQQNSNPEFHRLQDLPMDDLMEDTPLSSYTF